jgi:hypothetical protein
MIRDTKNIKSLVFVSLYSRDYSRSGVFYSGYPGEKNYLEFAKRPKQIIQQINTLKESFKFSDTIIFVMSPSHILVIYFKLFAKFKIVLDAGWPLSDSQPKAERNHPRYLSKIKNTALDFLSFKFADEIIFETEKQTDFSRKKFLLRKSKCHSIPTGFNELEFSSAVSNSRMPRELSHFGNSSHEFILFRGKNNREAGIEKIVGAAKILGKNFKFLIISNEEVINLPSNVLQISRYLSREELVWIYQHTSVVLGQFGNNNRLTRTTPHKFFEAAYFTKCYVTPRNIGLEGLADEKNVCFTRTSQSTDIADTLCMLSQNKELRILRSRNLRDNYDLNWSQTKLSDALMEIIVLN